MTYLNNLLHFFLETERGHFMLAYIGCGIVGTMPSPTARSGIAYQWAFGALNFFAANWMRTKAPKVENSPNYQDSINNLPGPVNKPVVVVEAPKP